MSGAGSVVRGEPVSRPAVRDPRRARRARLGILPAVVVLTLALPPWRASPAPAPAPASAPAPAGRYQAPVDGRLRVLRPFDLRHGPYGPGHRGVDLSARPPATVRAAAAGRVVFAGQVAGRGVVVILHPDGIRTEYEPILVRVRAGRPVAPGTVLGRVSGRHAGCPAACLHWGARRDGRYLDPITLLAALGPVRLIPCAC